MSPPYMIDSGRGDSEGLLNFRPEPKTPKKIISNRSMQQQWERFEERKKEKDIKIEL